jgi:hypothetical protein
VAQTWTVVDNNASALSIGATGKADILKIVSTDSAEGVTMSGTLGVTGNTTLTGSLSGDNPNINRLIRTNTGTGSNAILALNRARGDGARATDGGPWIGFEYVGTDNTQATSPQNAIRSMFDIVSGSPTGNNKLQFLQLPGNFNSPTVMGQVQRGNTFFNNTSGGSMLALTDSAATIRGSTTTITNSPNSATYATFAAGGIALNNVTTITGAGLSTISRTTVGTPTVVESRPSMNIQLIRSDQAGPTSGDGTGFRARTGGSNGTIYTISDMSSNYSSTGDTQWALGLANGDQTGATFDSLQTIRSKISETIIAAGTPSATPGASTVSTVATFAPTSTQFAASGTNYASFASSSSALTSSGQCVITRTSAVPASPSGQILRLSRTDQTGPQDTDGIDFRLSVGRTSTTSNFARFDGIYKSSGANTIGMSVSTDSFAADINRIYIGTRDNTKIQTTPAGGGTTGTTAEFTQLVTTLQTDQFLVKTAAGTTKLTVDTNKITAAVPVAFPVYTAAASAAVTGAVGWQISISDSPTVGGRMAFWDTTNARWSYISDNSAV